MSQTCHQKQTSTTLSTDPGRRGAQLWPVRVFSWARLPEIITSVSIGTISARRNPKATLPTATYPANLVNGIGRSLRRTHLTRGCHCKCGRTAHE